MCLALIFVIRIMREREETGGSGDEGEGGA